MNQFMTINAFLLGLTQIIFAYNFVYSMFLGPKASDNPWHANTLEWATSSPPPTTTSSGSRPSTTHRMSTASRASRKIICRRPYLGQLRPGRSIRSWPEPSHTRSLKKNR